MTTPKPAPSKPLTFTPPVYLKGETKYSELPTVESAEPNVISKKKGARADIMIIDEIKHDDNSIELELGYIEEREAKKAEKPKKPFILDSHLTQRPFHDDRLMQLKSRLQRPSFKNR